MTPETLPELDPYRAYWLRCATATPGQRGVVLAEASAAQLLDAHDALGSVIADIRRLRERMVADLRDREDAGADLVDSDGDPWAVNSATKRTGVDRDGIAEALLRAGSETASPGVLEAERDGGMVALPRSWFGVADPQPPTVRAPLFVPNVNAARVLRMVAGVNVDDYADVETVDKLERVD